MQALNKCYYLLCKSILKSYYNRHILIISICVTSWILDEIKEWELLRLYWKFITSISSKRDCMYLNCNIMKRDIKVCMRSKNGIAVKVYTTLETIRWPTQIPIYVYQIVEEGKYFFRLIYVYYMFWAPLRNIISAHTYFMLQCSSSQYFFCIFGYAASEPISLL